VDDAIAVTLKGRADFVLRFGPEPAARVGALGGLGCEDVALASL
jgi:hypothetical protein